MHYVMLIIGISAALAAIYIFTPILIGLILYSLIIIGGAIFLICAGTYWTIEGLISVIKKKVTDD